MAPLPTKSFDQIVTNTVSGIQGRALKFVNFSTGSTLKAIVEGFAGTFLWFQALSLQLLKASRLSTSEDDDVDTFTADWMPIVPGSQTVTLPGGSPRLGSQAASGQVTYARLTTSPTTCFVPVGAIVTTADGSNIAFGVIADATFASFSAVLNGYTLPANIASIIVPVEAVVPGSAGNVKAGTLTRSTTAIQGIDTVTNIADFFDGEDEEQDSELKKRFSDYILGLSRGDIFGLTASIEGAVVNVQFALTESYNYDGSYRPGFFFVVADDGSGNPSFSFMQKISDAAQAVRPLGIQCAVFSPIIILADVSMQITTLPGYDHNTVLAQAAAVVATNINSLGLGNDLDWSILASWARVPGVSTVRNVLLNGIYGDAASLSCKRTTGDGLLQYVTSTVKANDINVS